MLEQIRGNVLVHRELAGVDDAHVEAGLDRVIEKRGVHRLADDVVAAEREREVADAAADLHAGTRRLDERRRLDEVDRVLVVLLEAGRDGEHVRIEDDVGRIEAGLARSAAGTARWQISTLRSTVSAWPCSSNAMTTDGGAVAADESRPCAESPPRLPSARSS